MLSEHYEHLDPSTTEPAAKKCTLEVFGLAVLAAQFLLLFVFFWVSLGTNLHKREQTYSCTLDPSRSYPAVTDLGLVISALSSDGCRSCGPLLSCLYMKSQKLTGDCCADSCTDPQGEQVSSLQAVVRDFEWTLLMACYVPDHKVTYYIQRSCNNVDDVCKSNEYAYLQSRPRVSICRVNESAGPSVDCRTVVWDSFTTFLLVLSVVSFFFLVKASNCCRSSYE
jgi:hypothetical protein